eukprot:3300479-Pleurochrysis_carterae.AAC.5
MQGETVIEEGEEVRLRPRVHLYSGTNCIGTGQMLITTRCAHGLHVLLIDPMPASHLVAGSTSARRCGLFALLPSDRDARSLQRYLRLQSSVRVPTARPGAPHWRLCGGPHR